MESGCVKYDDPVQFQRCQHRLKCRVACIVLLQHWEITSRLVRRACAALTDEGVTIVGPLDQVVGRLVADHAEIFLKNKNKK